MTDSNADRDATKENRNSDHIVVLVHGFNTYANWMDAVKHSLRKHGFSAESTGYGYFGFFRFLSLPVFRRAPMNRVWSDIELAISKFERENGHRQIKFRS